MPLHIIKLAVGAESVTDMLQWQQGRLKQLKKAGKPRLLSHLTRMTPKRREDVLDGGSLYWVIKGYTGIRQRIVDLQPAVKDGHPACAIVYEAEVIPVSRRAQRAFQGWRYLKDGDIPRDLRGGEADLPEALQQALGDLGLL